jgi:uncharacterized protein YjbI with pentapeptide repeats
MNSRATMSLSVCNPHGDVNTLTQAEKRLLHRVDMQAKTEARAFYRKEQYKREQAKIYRAIQLKRKAEAIAETERIARIEAIIEQEKAIEWSAAEERKDKNNFEGQDLRGKTFIGENLMLANFNYANLSGADFTGANLRGATFEGANLTDAILNNTVMISLDYYPAASTHFDNANLTGAFICDSTIKGATFFGAKLNNADFSNTKLDYVDFTNSSMRCVTWRESTIIRCIFVNTDLHSTDFSQRVSRKDEQEEDIIIYEAKNIRFAKF